MTTSGRLTPLERPVGLGHGPHRDTKGRPMAGEECGVEGCRQIASGYADPGRAGGPFEAYVGHRLRPDQIQLCSTHLAEVARRPGMRRREVLTLDTVVRLTSPVLPRILEPVNDRCEQTAQRTARLAR